MFGSDFFVANRARLRQLFTGTAPIILTAAGQVQRGGDTTYQFFQDASFWYYTGIEDPDVVLVCDKDKEYLIVPIREATRVAFDGAIDEARLRRISGIDTIVDEREGWKRLGARLGRVKHAATLAAAPAYIESLGMYTNPARQRMITRLKSYNDQLELLDIGEHVARQRMIKQPIELEAMQKAIDITIGGLKTVFRPAKRTKYVYEYEIEADLTRAFRRGGAIGHAFAPIVASGARACTLHNERNDGELSADELLVCDVGAEYMHYAADITRTVSLGSPSRRQRAVYEAVLEVHAFAISLLKPGVLWKPYEQQVHDFMGEKLRELGLIKTIERDTVRQYYPHATSHFLGLNAHDVGLYDLPLEPGMVLTVEPGIYIHEEAIGIRIEDDILITSEGTVNLTDALPRSLA
jgi:Xaa-Pro aminopeptidase